MSNNILLTENGQIQINDLIIDEKAIFDSLKKFEEQNPDEPIYNKFRTLLQQGVLVDQAIPNLSKSDLVETKFAQLAELFNLKMNKDFPNKVDEYLQKFIGEEGTFSLKLTEKFEGNEELIKNMKEVFFDEYKKMMNLDDENSPLHKIKYEMTEQFKILSTFLDKKEKNEIENNTGTNKGAKFEDFIFPILSECAQFLNCNFEKTSAIKGVSGDKNSKKGDFVMTEKITNKKIVIEAKNLSKDPTTKQILEYSRIAIENRQSDYCIFIYCDNDDTSIPEAGMFNEISKNILFVTVSNTDSDDAKKRMIRLSCSWALQRIKSNESIDIDLDEKMKKFEGTLRNNLGTIKTIKNNSSSITKACSNMITDLEGDLGLKEKKIRKNIVT